MDIYRCCCGLVTVPISKVALGVSMGKSRVESMRRSVRGFIASSAFVDYRLGESVNTLLESDLVRHLYDKFGSCDYRIVYQFTRGEVLSDQRGLGTFQRVDDE